MHCLCDKHVRLAYFRATAVRAANRFTYTNVKYFDNRKLWKEIEHRETWSQRHKLHEATCTGLQLVYASFFIATTLESSWRAQCGACVRIWLHVRRLRNDIAIDELKSNVIQDRELSGIALVEGWAIVKEPSVDNSRLETLYGELVGGGRGAEVWNCKTQGLAKSIK